MDHLAHGRGGPAQSTATPYRGRGRGNWRGRGTNSGQHWPGHGTNRGGHSWQARGANRGGENWRGRGANRYQGVTRPGHENVARTAPQRGSGRHSRGRGTSCKKEKHQSLQDYLVSLEKGDGQSVVLELLQDSSLRRIIQGTSAVSYNMVPLIIILLKKAASCSAMPQMVSQSLSLLQQSPFLLTTVVGYVTKLPAELMELELQVNLRAVIALVGLFIEMLTRIPHSFTAVAGLVTIVEFACGQIRNGDALKNVSPDITDMMATLDSDLQDLTDQRDATAAMLREQPRQTKTTEQNMPQKFRQMSVYPTQDEVLNEEKPILRANKFKGKYANATVYLDTQFQLLREDCVGPLRDGITEYISIQRTRSHVGRLQDGRVYHNVTIKSEFLGREGIYHSIRFDVSHIKRVNWKTTRCLIYGSLVCLSCDGFKSFLIGTVSEREPDDLERGRIEIQFLHPIEDEDYISKRYEMVETTAYFEAYRPVLEALQSIREEEFPFYNYIIDCCVEVKCPRYVLSFGITTYDLSPLKAKNKHIPTIHNVPFLELDKWPDLSKFELDNSQLQAVKSALTREFVIIQGPPGTGKTYVGLKIVQVLLQNKPKWNGPGDGPILVVCYTNHALDQFLEGIDDFLGGGIIRVGGRSKSEKLEKYLLKGIRGYINHDLVEVKTGVEDEVREAKRSYMDELQQIQAAQTKVLLFSMLEQYMTTRQASDLVRSAEKLKKPEQILRQWLAVNDDEFTTSEISCHLKEIAKRILIISLLKTEVCLDVYNGIGSNSAMTIQERSNIQNLWDLSPPDRWRLYRYWRIEYFKKLTDLQGFYQSQNYKLGGDVINAKIDALSKGVIHELYLMDIDGLLQEFVKNHKGKYPFFVQWLGLMDEYNSTSQVRSAVADQCWENISYYFSFLVSHRYQGKVDICERILENLNQEDALSDDEATALENRKDDLNVHERWSLYRYWRNKLLLFQFDWYFSQNLRCFHVEHEETKAMIHGLWTGIIHERYLTDVTDCWTKNKMRHARYVEESENHSEMLHWLGLQEICPCMQKSVQESESDGIIIDDDESTRRRDQLEYGDEYDDFIAVRHRRQTQRNRQELVMAATIPFQHICREWKTVHKRGKNNMEVEDRLSEEDETMTKPEAEQVQYLWDLALPERWRLYRYWIKLYIYDVKTALRETKKRYPKACKLQKELRFLEKESVLQRSEVVGMTTTCAANYRSVLQRIKPKIVIVEEAAEVLESHIVTTLSEGCQHLILIGDHKQLRPNPNVYELAKKYNLEISLFERMINNGISFNCLEKQHRMRPEIAALMKPIYPELVNHEVVYTYEDVKGVSSNLYFIDHKEMETNNEELRSKSNDHEAQFIVCLCRYFIQQGYDASQITILTLYTGQVLKIKDVMRKVDFNFRGVHISAVDNFQGEENDIVLLSLVRSNAEGQIGFLKIHNRVTVALSRAKKGLYVIGNFSLLASSHQTTLWRKLVDQVKENGNLGPSLRLSCQNHPDTFIEATTAKDFNKAPDGGCMKLCDTRLTCGHVCTRRCHVDDKDHEKFQCRKPCSRECIRGHKCHKLCYKECECPIKVTKKIPKCGHDQEVPCCVEPEDFVCQERCNADLCDTGHTCMKLCHKGSKCGSCNVLVEKTIPECSHQITILCHQSPRRAMCRAPCERTCDQGHECQKRCSLICGKCPVLVSKDIQNCGHKQEMPCWQRPETFDCKALCERLCKRDLHLCKQLCHETCKPCKVEVELEIPACEHIQAMQCCQDPVTFKCQQIVERPLPRCGHSRKMKCSVNPGDVKCVVQCEKKCENNHSCKKRCFEDCGNCLVLIDKVIKKCGHTQQMACFLDPEEFKCQAKCERSCCCHPCKQHCSEACEPCKEVVEKVLPCKHIKMTECSKSIALVKCKDPCEKTLICGHKCPAMCHQECPPCMKVVERTLPSCPEHHKQSMKCHENPDDVVCKAKVKKQMPTCDHVQEMKCSQPPETFNCAAHCKRYCREGHQCKQLCYEVCKPCTVLKEKSIPSCGHLQKMKCHQDPTLAQCEEVVPKEMPLCQHTNLMKCWQKPALVKCDAICNKKLKCGHKCARLCYEKCDPLHCSVQVEKPLPYCGHSVVVSCSKPAMSKVCDHPCTHCSHKCSLTCGSRCRLICRVPLTCTLECGHTIVTQCKNISKTNNNKKMLQCNACTANSAGTDEDDKPEVVHQQITDIVEVQQTHNFHYQPSPVFTNTTHHTTAQRTTAPHTTAPSSTPGFRPAQHNQTTKSPFHTTKQQSLLKHKKQKVGKHVNSTNWTNNVSSENKQHTSKTGARPKTTKLSGSGNKTEPQGDSGPNKQQTTNGARPKSTKLSGSGNKAEPQGNSGPNKQQTNNGARPKSTKLSGSGNKAEPQGNSGPNKQQTNNGARPKSTKTSGLVGNKATRQTNPEHNKQQTSHNGARPKSTNTTGPIGNKATPKSSPERKQQTSNSVAGPNSTKTSGPTGNKATQKGDPEHKPQNSNNGARPKTTKFSDPTGHKQKDGKQP